MSGAAPTASPSEVVRSMVSMFDTGKVDGVARIVDQRYFDHQDGVRGPDGFAEVVAGARDGYSALKVVVEDLLEAEDRVAVRLRWIATLPAGGTQERQTIDIVRVADGRAVEHWGGRS